LLFFPVFDSYQSHLLLFYRHPCCEGSKGLRLISP
jgi:hypothetical protein